MGNGRLSLLIGFLSALVLIFSVTSPVGAVHLPIYLDAEHTKFYDFDFYVASSVTLVPGQTGFLHAALTNTGTEPATFKWYDHSNPYGGYGWDFNTPGMAVGVGSYSLGSTRFVITGGHVDPLIYRPFPWSPYPTSDFSNLSNVTINPGNILVFDINSIVLDPSVSPGLHTTFRTDAAILFGAPVYAGFRTELYDVDVFAGNSFANGPLQQVALSKISWIPSASVPEPSTDLFLGLGAPVVGLCLTMPSRLAALP